MRQKRAKTYKRVMALYVQAFNFRQPYQLLVSNDFLVEASKQDIDLFKLLSTCVQGEIKPMITQCCIDALYKLGKEFQPVVNIAKKCERRKCNHREAIGHQDCLQDVIGPSNKHRYVLAVQSPKFLSTMSAIAGLPMIHFNPRGVLVLSPPSTSTIRHKNNVEEERRVQGAQILDGVVDGDNVLGSAAAAASSTAAAPPTRSRKAKAPNPLSVRKKKVVVPKAGTTDLAPAGGPKKRSRHDEDGGDDGDDDENAQGGDREGGTLGGAGGDGGDDAAAGRRKKKRKRGRGKGAVAAAIAEMTGRGTGGDDAGGDSDSD